MRSSPRLAFSHRCNVSSQGGAALLILMLLLVTGASYVLVSKLNDNFTRYSRQAVTARVLSEAKAGLIMYSVTYPENHASGGPGILPCPDINNNGSAVANCSAAGSTLLGRFPWKTVGTGEFRDHAGETLWYAVSDNFRTPVTGVINSETAGTLSVDATSDIVAVIFAPGPPVANQDRSGGPLLAANYLEAGNEVQDNNFYTRSASEFTDQVVYVTRGELMGIVEKRVLGDVARAIDDYQGSGWNPSSIYPWLSNFIDPGISAFRGQAGSIRGHLPFHWGTDPEAVVNGGAVAGRNPYTTDYSLSWDSLSGANITQNTQTTGWLTLSAPTSSCVRNSQCSNGSDTFNGLVPSSRTINAASCTWTDNGSFGCPPVSYTFNRNNVVVWSTANIFGYKNNSGSGWIQIYTNTDGSYGWEWAWFNSWSGSGWGNYSIDRVVQFDIQRQYDVTINLTDTDGIDINPPTAGEARTRDLDISGALSPSSITVTVTDTITNIDIQYPDYNISPVQSVTTLVSNAGTTGNIMVDGLQYDLDIDGGELPAWFVDNGWHELIYVAYASGEGSPPGTSICSAGSNCITINGSGGANDNKRVVVMSAGPELSTLGQDRSSSPGLADFFENVNAVEDDVFEANNLTNFNDRIRILAEAP